MSQKFQNAKIYKITNDHNNEVYVGSTCSTLVKRFQNHKSQAKNKTNSNRQVYKLINEIGFENFKIDLIENYPCENLCQLREREGYYIRQIGTLNMKIEGMACEKEYQHSYYMQNKEKVMSKVKEWYQNNKVQRSEYMQTYSEKNREKLQNIAKENYYKNKEQIKQQKQEVIVCECGCETDRGHIQRHRKTQRHLTFLEKNISI